MLEGNFTSPDNKAGGDSVDNVIPTSLNEVQSSGKPGKRLVRRKSELPQDAQTQKALTTFKRHDTQGLNAQEE